MKQYRITTGNISMNDDDDCYLAPDDIIHELKIQSYLDGLGAKERLAEYRMNNNPMHVSNNRISKINQDKIPPFMYQGNKK